MLVMKHAVLGSKVPFHLGETAKYSIAVSTVADVLVFVYEEDWMDADLEIGVAALKLKMQRTENKYQSRTCRAIFVFVGRNCLD